MSAGHDREALEALCRLPGSAAWLIGAAVVAFTLLGAPVPARDALQAFRNYVTLAPNAPNVGTVKTKIVELEDRLASGATSPPRVDQPQAPAEKPAEKMEKMKR